MPPCRAAACPPAACPPNTPASCMVVADHNQRLPCCPRAGKHESQTSAWCSSQPGGRRGRCGALAPVVSLSARPQTCTVAAEAPATADPRHGCCCQCHEGHTPSGGCASLTIEPRGCTGVVSARSRRQRGWGPDPSGPRFGFLSPGHTSFTFLVAQTRCSQCPHSRQGPHHLRFWLPQPQPLFPPVVAGSQPRLGSAGGGVSASARTPHQIHSSRTPQHTRAGVCRPCTACCGRVS